MEMIYCAGGNRRFGQIAIEAGFLYGSQLPNTVYFPLHFADQNWKKPNRAAYMAALAKHRPHIASVLDLEREEQLPEVLSWAEEAAQFVSVVMIIPKVFGIIDRLPRHIGQAEVRLGYSVPTRFGATEVPAWEFSGWPVHLLGGTPKKQMELVRYMNVQSVDGNTAKKGAMYGNYWTSAGWRDLDSIGYEGGDKPYYAFALSCKNIAEAWKEILA